MAAFAGLAGMFSKQAIDWLERLFNTAFTSADELPDSLESKGPQIESVTPGGKRSSEFLDIRGQNFGGAGAQVGIGAKIRPAVVVSSNLLRAVLSESERQEGSLSVRVIRAGGVASNEVNVELPSS